MRKIAVRLCAAFVALCFGLSVAAGDMDGAQRIKVTSDASTSNAQAISADHRNSLGTAITNSSSAILMEQTIDRAQRNPLSASLPATSTTSSLLTGLVSYWAMEGASGATETDLVTTTGNDLTQNNTVGTIAGKVNNARTFTSAGSKYLSHTDNASLSLSGTSFTIAWWMYMTSLPSGEWDVVAHWIATGNQRAFIMSYGSTASHFTFDYSANGSTIATVTAASPSPALANTWYHIICYYDKVAGKIYIKVNNAGSDNQAVSGDLFDSTTGFGVGARNNGTAGYGDGYLDELVIWNRAPLTSAEMTSLAGGVTYPAFAFCPWRWGEFAHLVSAGKLPWNKFFRPTLRIEWKTGKFNA